MAHWKLQEQEGLSVEDQLPACQLKKFQRVQGGFKVNKFEQVRGGGVSVYVVGGRMSGKGREEASHGIPKTT